jgi:hypothetical protein
VTFGWTLRATLAPLAASPSQAHPLRLPPGYGILWSSGRGRLKRGATVAVRSSLAGVHARFAPRYRQPSAAVMTDSAMLAHKVRGPLGHPGVAKGVRRRTTGAAVTQPHGRSARFLHGHQCQR